MTVSSDFQAPVFSPQRPGGAADFVGIFPDESSDEAGTVQLPNAWRPVVLEQNILALFLDLYSKLPAGAGPARLVPWSSWDHFSFFCNPTRYHDLVHHLVRRGCVR